MSATAAVVASSPTYPNMGDKHANPSIVTPEKNLEYRRRVGLLPDGPPPEAVVLCFHESVPDRCVAREGSTGVITSHRGLMTLKSTDHRIGVAGGFGYGAPAATLVLEELIALGVQRFISIGTAGGLDPDAEVGELVVCSAAVRDEGVSHHYVPTARYAHPSADLTSSLAQRFERSGRAHRRGRSWTIDAPYRETAEEAALFRAEGVLTVEMEAAALFAVGQHRGVEVAAAFVVSDLLRHGTWEPHMHDAVTIAGLYTLFDVALSTLTS